MSKEKTVDVVRGEVLNHIRDMVNYWESSEGKTSKEKLDGLAFSILVMLDGESNLPPFIVAPLESSENIQFAISEGRDYYPENKVEIVSKIKCDIAGSLHDQYYQVTEEK
jgi:hypothetical protein